MKNSLAIVLETWSSEDAIENDVNIRFIDEKVIDEYTQTKDFMY